MESDGGNKALLECPWVPVCISGSQLLTKTWFGDTAYHVLLTDLHCVWEEEMDSTAIQGRAQLLNRRLRAPSHAFFSHLCEVARPCLSMPSGRRVEDGAPAALLSLTRPGSDLHLKLRSELAGVPFYWEFRCTPAPIALVCSQLVRPLLLMSRLLQKQVGQMGELLVSKDVEIQDYKDNGAVLTRERLQTDLFEEQPYKGTFLTQAVPEMCARQDSLSFDSELQELYSAVTCCSYRNTCKRRISERQSAGEDESATQDQELNQAPSITQFQAEDVHHQLSQPSPIRPGDQARVINSEKPSDDQIKPPIVAASDRPSTRPKKKKAKGIFG
ncbi:hypothetical protein UPYG_G00023750 [Umbra pygmaea]|uniref:Non-homologous end-joining factor 1 n=1 Tax=Umbra pygmaea TaxID=75934 RepID=A0ABD0XLE5_UMBPY